MKSVQLIDMQTRPYQLIWIKGLNYSILDGRIHHMSAIKSAKLEPRIYGLQEWLSWLDQLSTSIFGMTGPEFEYAWTNGSLAHSEIANDIASLLPLINRLRQRSVCQPDNCR